MVMRKLIFVIGTAVIFVSINGNAQMVYPGGYLMGSTNPIMSYLGTPKVFDQDGLTVFNYSVTSVDSTRWFNSASPGSNIEKWARLNNASDPIDANATELVTVQRNPQTKIVEAYDYYGNQILMADGKKSLQVVGEEYLTKARDIMFNVVTTKALIQNINLAIAIP